MVDLGASCAVNGLGALRSLLDGSGQWELRVSHYLPGKPRLERDTFSGGVNVSAQRRNLQRLDEALRVYRMASAPGILFCAPWVFELIKREAAHG